MTEPRERHEALTLGLYEAAQDPDRMPAFLAALSRHFDAHIAGLRVHDPQSPGFTAGYIESTGLPAPEWEDFDKSCGTRNIWRRKGFEDMKANGVSQSDSILSRRELIKTSFYQDCLKKLDIDYGMGICLWFGESDQAAVLSLNRQSSAGVFDDEAVAEAARLLPHFRSAYAVMRRLRSMARTSSSIAAALDQLNLGVWLLSRSGHRVYHNALADRARIRENGIELSASGRLRCKDASAQAQLDAAIANGAAGRLANPARVSIRDPNDRLVGIVVITMLRGDETPRGVTGESACVSVFLHIPRQRSDDSVDLLRAAWNLTAAEGRLAAQLADGGDVAQCAAALGISMPTARTQLRSLFVKTDTSRQSKLVSALEFVLRAP